MFWHILSTACLGLVILLLSYASDYYREDCSQRRASEARARLVGSIESPYQPQNGSPLLSLPAELRLQLYSYLLQPDTRQSPTSLALRQSCRQLFHEVEDELIRGHSRRIDELQATCVEVNKHYMPPMSYSVEAFHVAVTLSHSSKLIPFGQSDPNGRTLAHCYRLPSSTRSITFTFSPHPRVPDDDMARCFYHLCRSLKILFNPPIGYEFARPRRIVPTLRHPRRITLLMEPPGVLGMELRGFCLGLLSRGVRARGIRWEFAAPTSEVRRYVVLDESQWFPWLFRQVIERLWLRYPDIELWTFRYKV